MFTFDRKNSIITFQEDTYIPFLNKIVGKGYFIELPTQEQVNQEILDMLDIGIEDFYYENY